MAPGYVIRWQCLPAAAEPEGSSDCWSNSGRDNDMQQIFPEEAWGKNYLTAPWSNSDDPGSLMRNMYKVAVKDPTTVVKLNNVPLTGLIGNTYYYFESTTADHIEADKPVMVAQFASGGSPCSTGLGDPEMVYLSPVEQAIKKVGFYRNTQEKIEFNYLTLIIPTNGIGSLKIDGTSFSAIPAGSKFSYTHPNIPGYSVCVRRWASAKTQSFVQSDSAFTAITYGLGSAESYAFNAGTYINNLNARTLIHNQLDTARTANNFTCIRTNVELSLLIAFKPSQIKWQMSYVSQIQPNPGDLVTGDGISIIEPEDSMLVENKLFYKYRVPGNPYTFSSVGTFNIPVSAKNPASDLCDPFEKFFIDVLVKDRPTADFTFTQTGCPADGVQFTGNTTGNGYTIGQWYWQFPSGTPARDSIQNPLFTFPTSDTTYAVKLTAVSDEGCPADTTKNVVIPPGIKTSFTVTPSVCLGDPVTITPGPTATTEWYWVFGDGQADTLTSGNVFKHYYDSAGTYQIRHAIKGGGTCNSDTSLTTVTVYAKPFASFAISPTGCLPESGLVQFTSQAFAPDGQALDPFGYQWSFTDATVDTRDAAHVFDTFGLYHIGYQVKTVNGCAKDTAIDVTFNVKPQVTYNLGVSSSVCANAAPFSVAGARVTNGVPGTGIYKGAGIINSISGMYDPAQVAPGNDTVWYVFTSVGGCSDTSFAALVLHPVPQPEFTFNSTCLPAAGTVSFTNTTTVANSSPLTYKWTFGDVLTDTFTTVNPVHNFSAEGIYTVKLLATANGCTAAKSIDAAVSIHPVLVATPIAGICANGSPIVLNFGSVTNGVVGAYLYRGSGVTDLATGTFDPAVAAQTGSNPHKVWYIFNTAGGCIDSVSADINIAPVPVADFSINEGLGDNVCLNSSALLTSRSTISSGAIATWNWSFSNGEVFPPYLNGSAFRKYFAAAGSTDVKLYVVSDSGCVSQEVTKTVQVRPLPVADFTTATAVCKPGAMANFTNLSSIADQSVLTFQWSFGDNSPVLDVSSPQHTYNDALTDATVSLLATSPYGCVADTSKVVAFYAKPIADFSINRDTICQGAQTVFTDVSTVVNSTITAHAWSFGNGTTSAAPDPALTFSNPGQFAVTLVVTSAQGCTADTTRSVTVYLQPKIDAGPSVLVAEGDTITLHPVVNSSNLAFLWTPGFGLNNPTALQPTVRAMLTQTYTLTATGMGNCQASDTVTVRVARPVKIPNAFSPNGDGINDTWLITHLEDYPNSIVEIFNRYGKSVHKISGGSSQSWDGKLNGSPLPVGTYYYVVNLRDGTPPYSGYVAIIR